MDEPTRVCCYGSSRQAVLTMLVFAKHCPDVTFTIVDDDMNSIREWEDGVLPVREQGVELLLQQRGKNVHFSYNIDQTITEANVIFLGKEKKLETQGLGTNKLLDLGPWVQAVKRIRRYAMTRKLIVERFPHLHHLYPNSRDDLLYFLDGGPVQHDVVLNPQFCSVGTLIQNLENPAEVIIALTSPNANPARLMDLYTRWIPVNMIRFYDSREVQFSVLAHDVILGLQGIQLGLIRAMADRAQVNNDNVLAMVGVDGRLAPNLRSSIAVGGPEILKNITYSAELASKAGHSSIANFLKMSIQINKIPLADVVKIMEKRMATLNGQTIALFGFSCEEGTDEIWDSPALHLCGLLFKGGARLRINDPLVDEDTIMSCFPRRRKRIQVIQDVIQTCQDASAICILHSSQHQNTNFQAARAVMENPAYFFDLSCSPNLNHAQIRDWGFITYVGGRPIF